MILRLSLFAAALMTPTVSLASACAEVDGFEDCVELSGAVAYTDEQPNGTVELFVQCDDGCELTIAQRRGVIYLYDEVSESRHMLLIPRKVSTIEIQGSDVDDFVDVSGRSMRRAVVSADMGPGDDELFVHQGTILQGGEGDDLLVCQSCDTLSGQGGDDSLVLFTSREESGTVDGGPGDDWLYGTAGKDTLMGGPGENIIKTSTPEMISPK